MSDALSALLKEATADQIPLLSENRFV
jgi:hypothetical protein